MLALARYMLSGRSQALAATTLLNLVALLIPPTAFIVGGTPVALVTLRKGPLVTVQLLAGTFLLVTAGLLLAGLSPWLALGLFFGIWLPVVLAAIVLRRQESQGAMLTMVALIAALFVSLMYLTLGDVESWWRGYLEPQFAALLADKPDKVVQELLEGAVPLVNGVMAAGLVISITTATLLARWYQAALFNPGGFGQEFRALSLPRSVALAIVISMFGAFLLDGLISQWLRDLVFVGTAVFLFQGLALCHHQVKQRGWSVNWLVAMYLLIILLPQALLFTACLGFADAWLRGGEARLTRPPDDSGPDDGSKD